jgi:hypothetical protein
MHATAAFSVVSATCPSTCMLADMAIAYRNIDDVDLTEMCTILNSDDVRHHLIKHDLFTEHSIKEWISGKKSLCLLDPRVYIKSCYFEQRLMGWCGIQMENGRYGLGIILDKDYWGFGRQIYRHLLDVADRLKIRELYVYLLGNRHSSRALIREGWIPLGTDSLEGFQFLVYKRIS